MIDFLVNFLFFFFCFLSAFINSIQLIFHSHRLITLQSIINNIEKPLNRFILNNFIINNLISQSLVMSIPNSFISLIILPLFHHLIFMMAQMVIFYLFLWLLGGLLNLFQAIGLNFYVIGVQVVYLCLQISFFDLIIIVKSIACYRQIISFVFLCLVPCMTHYLYLYHDLLFSLNMYFDWDNHFEAYFFTGYYSSLRPYLFLELSLLDNY